MYNIEGTPKHNETEVNETFGLLVKNNLKSILCDLYDLPENECSGLIKIPIYK